MADADIYSLLMEPDPQATQQRAEALAAALRGQQMHALMSIGTGDKVLGRSGAAMLEQAQQQEKLLAGAGEQRMGSLLRAALASEAAKRAEANRLEGHQWALDAAKQSQAEAMKRSYVEAGRLQGNELEGDVAALSKRLELTPAMRNDLGVLVKGAQQPDVPGVGPVVGRLPDWAVSDQAVRLRQAARGVLGGLIKEQSGQAASEQEVSRKLAELGMGPGATDQQFRIGLQRLTQNARDSIRSKEAGARPEALHMARQRGVVTSQDIPEFISRKRIRDTKTGRTGWWDGSAPLPAGVEVVQ